MAKPKFEFKDQYVSHVTGLVAVENKEIGELLAALEDLKKERKSTKKDLRKIIHIWKYLSRTEIYVDRDMRYIVGELNVHGTGPDYSFFAHYSPKGFLEKVTDLDSKLEKYRKILLTALSRGLAGLGMGEVGQELSEIRKIELDLEKHAKDADRKKVFRLITNLERVLSDLKKWTAGAEAVLKQVRDLMEEASVNINVEHLLLEGEMDRWHHTLKEVEAIVKAFHVRVSLDKHQIEAILDERFSHEPVKELNNFFAWLQSHKDEIDPKGNWLEELIADLDEHHLQRGLDFESTFGDMV